VHVLARSQYKENKASYLLYYDKKIFPPLTLGDSATHHTSNQMPPLTDLSLAASFIEHAAIWRAIVIYKCGPGKKCQCPSSLDHTLQDF
jgi:hypothetical protein